MAGARRASRSVVPVRGSRSSGARGSRSSEGSGLGSSEGSGLRSRAGGRLRSGADGFEYMQVAQIQRTRILSAMVEVVLELGVANLTVAHVVQRAGVSRRTYYELFADCEECFLAGLDDALERIAAVVVLAYERECLWQERIRGALGELLGLFDEDRGLGRLVVVESLAAGPRALQRRNRVLAGLIAVVDEGRVCAGAGCEPQALTAEGVVGAVSSILYSCLVAGTAPVAGGSRVGEDCRSLVELTGPLMGIVVLPYLGQAAARRELARPVPVPRAGVGHGGAYSFRDLGMRLTYRTLRVLDAVAVNPGVSNRRVGEVAGISDQGQISKLLARLQHLGLIENVVGVSGKGAPNAWRLTEEGQSMHRAIQTPRGG
jgi:AcrR family transcriptional regulator